GVLLCALCALCARASPYPSAVPIPPELESTVVKVPVNSTPCSVTCGLGLQVEELCEVTPAGEKRNCSFQRSLCVASWICGLRHVSVPAGRPLWLSCLVVADPSLGNYTYGYTWSLARGLITTNDLLFQPLRHPRPALRLAPATEGDAGTYRCDAQLRETFKLVKRVYFGLKVIPSKLVDLNFQKSLTREQKLAAKLEGGNSSWTEQERFWEREEFYEALMGTGSGVVGGVLVSVVLCFCQRL
ncbi:TMM81 protein, partial [Scytalopus superciliaris]|nr:TMM81 protein [Scytalopus superciliaris]